VVSFGLARTALAFDPAKGPLHAEHFQMAYATNDIERAKRLFGERLGVREWKQLAGPLPSGGQIHVELAWVGSIMYELITATGEGSALYMDRLPHTQSFHVKHHHLGYLIRSQAEWEALLAGAERHGWPLVHQSHTAGFMQSCFIDAPALGHYLEYLFPENAGLEFFRSVPNQQGAHG
jgi:catechol 2,3-dioxygenase-like lactoylglutathione lyase family enzyme